MKVFSTAMALALGIASAQKATLQAPQVVVYYLNKNAGADACNAKELKYVDNKITPDLDMILRKMDYGETQWSLTVDDAPARMLRGGEERELNANCDFCRRYYPRHLCNSMYNCGFRRELQSGKELTGTNKTDLSAALKSACKDNLALSASRKMLGGTCANAIAAAECHVEFN